MISMDGIILAHNGGLDELAIVLFPLIVGGGVWALTRQPKKVKPAPDPDGGEVRSIREPRPAGRRWGGSGPTP